jgi:dienelactone hydrolase
MPYVAAHLLDGFNEWLVASILRGRIPPSDGAPVATYLEALGDDVHPDPAALGSLEPASADGPMWEAVTPWPGVSGNNRRWVARRVAPAGRKAPPARHPALILLHGWLMDRAQSYFYRYWARSAAKRGIEVWLPRLPYHFERAEPDEISGQKCLSPDLGTSLDAVRQAVAEARLLAGWLRTNGAPRVGIWGMSLGGWVAALAATLDEDWDAVALWAPVAAPAEVLWESGLVELLREAIAAGGLSVEDFEAPAFSAMTPSRRVPLVPRDRIQVTAAAYDHVVSPRSVAAMARRWNADVRWVPHGHISLMASRLPVRDTVAFLDEALG